MGIEIIESFKAFSTLRYDAAVFVRRFCSGGLLDEILLARCVLERLRRFLIDLKLLERLLVWCYVLRFADDDVLCFCLFFVGSWYDLRSFLILKF